MDHSWCVWLKALASHQATALSSASCVNRKEFSTKTKNEGSLDDIPIALRSHVLHGVQEKRSFFSFSGATFPVLLLILGVGVVATGLLRVFFPASPVSGLYAHLSRDGRLLGHFPYPEANPTQMVEVAPGHLLRPDAAKAFLEMQRSAATDGVELILLSAFRSLSEQNKLFFEVKANRNQSSLERAKVSAPPGFSEHSTGYAIDIGDLSQPQTNLSPSFAHTRSYQWLKSNAARFQFVLSFPENNPQSISFEPWHWRYEGSTESLRLFEPAQRLIQDVRGGQVR